MQTDKQTDAPYQKLVVRIEHYKQTDATLQKVGGEDKTLQTGTRNPQGIPTVVQKRDDNNRGIKQTSFEPKNVMSSTGGSN